MHRRPAGARVVPDSDKRTNEIFHLRGRRDAEFVAEELAIGLVTAQRFHVIALGDVTANQEPLRALPQWFGGNGRQTGLDCLPDPAALDQILAELLQSMEPELVESFPLQQRPLVVTVAK